MSGTHASLLNGHVKWPEWTKDDMAGIMAATAGMEKSVWAPIAGQARQELAALSGVDYCHLVGNGTQACHVALVGAGVSPDDHVLVPALSFGATATAVRREGATPIFCDVRPDTWEIDLNHAGTLITPKTTAIMPVHAHGLPCDMDALRAFADRYSLALAEDAAQAAGAVYRGQPAGSFGDTAAFSGNIAKSLQCVDLGWMVTADADRHDAMVRVSQFGERRPRPLQYGEIRPYRFEYDGHNYRAHPLPIGLLLAQKQRHPRFLKTARENAAILVQGLRTAPGLTPPYMPPERESCWTYFRVVIDPNCFDINPANTPKVIELRDRVIYRLRLRGLHVTAWQLRPLPSQPAFRRPAVPWVPGMTEMPMTDWCQGDYPVTTHTLNSSFILGEIPYPLWLQPLDLSHRYVEIIGNTMTDDVEDILKGDYQPLPITPPIPADEL